ncbi:MAG: MFS transporter [Proteobacteria bacterium]|nr:MFS transporter [Pseudomonadota bacterium]
MNSLLVQPRAWFAFSMTGVLIVFGFLDRQLVVSLFPLLKAEWALSDTQLGTLVSASFLAIALGALPAGLLVDRSNRVNAIALMAVCWSSATLASALCGGFGQLVAARVFLGLSEAGLIAAAGALLAAYFPRRLHGGVLGAVTAFAALGGLFGVALGGTLAAKWGWQAAFVICGAPGFVLAGAYWMTVRDIGTQAGPAPRRASLLKPLLNRSSLAVYLGCSLQLMLSSALMAWVPSFLGRYHGFSVPKAALATAAVFLAGVIGMVFWGMVADRLSKDKGSNRLLVPAVLSAASFGLVQVVVGVETSTATALAALAGASFVIAGVLGPGMSVLVDVVPPGSRAASLSALTFAQNLLGQAVGPVLAGALSDAYGLLDALWFVSGTSLAAALVFWAGTRFYSKDVAALQAA